MRRRAALLVLAGAALAARALVAAPGDPAQVTGRVSNSRGEPIAGVEVRLEASRTRFDGRTLRRVPEETRVVAAIAGEQGDFTLDWPGGEAYDRFVLRAGLEIRKAGGDHFVEMARSDLSRRMGQGSPVVATLEIDDTGLLDALRSFLASLRSDDERRTYQEFGKPDSIEIVRGAGWTEATWWYFEEGRACFFRDGRRLEVRAFDPVRAF